ncbi:MerR family transcriptional regulator [Mesocricetibacter intestinalis]|uniref:MerR family transcriptional regulator n=1 Tax=Mesocricetibacter intestinalis TaxID=1521930 RepID=UPI00105ECC96
MKALFKLDQVAKLLNIPTSTLRYWDKQGLIRFERNRQNQYRQISLHNLCQYYRCHRISGNGYCRRTG